MFMEALTFDVGADDGERSAAGRKQAARFRIDRASPAFPKTRFVQT
jgi:hypothetical protein